MIPNLRHVPPEKPEAFRLLAPQGAFSQSSVILGIFGLTRDWMDSTALLVFERAYSDFTRPISLARNASGRFAKSFMAAAAVSVNETAQGHRPVRTESRRRYLCAALRS